MINYNIAEAAVLKFLAKEENEINEFGSALQGHSREPKVTLVISEVIEHDFGWVFCYNDRQYIETGNSSFAMAGNAPLIFNRNDGHVYITSSGESLESCIAKFKNGDKVRA